MGNVAMDVQHRECIQGLPSYAVEAIDQQAQKREGAGFPTPCNTRVVWVCALMLEFGLRRQLRKTTRHPAVDMVNLDYKRN